MLENVKYEGRRITKRIKELSEFNLVATAPGSLQLVLKKPSLNKFILSCDYEKQEEISEESYIIDVRRFPSARTLHTGFSTPADTTGRNCC